MAVSEERVTRGRLLKRAGIGAAALGAGSMLTASTAGAAPATACASVGGCGDCVDVECPNCFNHPCCFCFVTVEGGCACSEDFYCSTVPKHECVSSKQCPPGWACVRSACDAANGYTTQCAPPCGTHTPGTVCSGGVRPQTLKGKNASGK